MNERIQKLAEQAGLKYYNWSTNESNIIDGEFKYPRLEDYKKFAELIINECGVALKPMLRDTISRGEAVVLIREHFGVVK